MNDENLPAVNNPLTPTLLPNIKFPDVEHVGKPTYTDEQTASLDMQLDMYAFKMLGWAWGEVRSIGDMERVMRMQHVHQREHHNHRLMPNAHQNSSGRVFTVTPLD